MRERLVVALLAITASAYAGPKKAADKPAEKAADKAAEKPIDLAPVIEKLAAYKDDVGNYYVAPQPALLPDMKEAEKWVFYGDGKTMYRQWVVSSAKVKGGVDWYLWAPRAKDMTTADLQILGKDMFMQCRPVGGGGKRPLTELTGDEAQTLFQRAKFYPPLWTRSARFLARDDDANYYYVDSLKDELGGKGYRVFIGLKGAMKQISITNMASDTAGQLYATKSGQLKISHAKEGNDSAFFIRGGTKLELTIVPVTDNRYLIYRELGIYTQLGTVCDDQ
ncbi:MAG TPA: hypothetical protein VLB44_20460 [Kofleriaceae bacterium]|nr:hypothetical protein [Kofleriaceae bacterium]